MERKNIVVYLDSVLLRLLSWESCFCFIIKINKHILKNFIPTALAQSENLSKTSQIQPADLVDSVGYIALHLPKWITGLAIIIFCYILSKKAGKKISQKIMASQKKEVSKNSIILVERATKLFIVFIGITIALAINGVNFTLLIGFLSIGIGFAVQGIVGNFLSSIIMLAQNRMSIGDMVMVNGVLGSIVGIDRNTVLKGIDGKQMIVPNQTMLNSVVINYTINPFRRIQLLVGVSYKTDLEKAFLVINEVIKNSKDIESKPAPMILISEFGESAIILSVYFWIESKKPWPTILSDFALQIKEAFEQKGIQIPLPIRTLKIDEDDRALLKTIDSMRKGYIPDIQPHVSSEKVFEAANNTENAPIIPMTYEEVKVPEKPTEVIQMTEERPKPPPTHL